MYSPHFPYAVEYECINSRNSCHGQSEAGARDLMRIFKASRHVVSARMYKIEESKASASGYVHVGVESWLRNPKVDGAAEW